MVRTQVQVTELQLKMLKSLSAKTGQSISELIRHGIDQYLAGQHQPSMEERIERAVRVAGTFSSGVADVSRDHDGHLAEAYRQ